MFIQDFAMTSKCKKVIRKELDLHNIWSIVQCSEERIFPEDYKNRK